MAFILIVLGLVVVAASIGELVLGHTTIMNIVISGVIGATLLVAGLILLVTTILETWLSRTQTALVDGLQAGYTHVRNKRL